MIQTYSKLFFFCLSITGIISCAATKYWGNYGAIQECFITSDSAVSKENETVFNLNHNGETDIHIAIYEVNNYCAYRRDTAIDCRNTKPFQPQRQRADKMRHIDKRIASSKVRISSADTGIFIVMEIPTVKLKTTSRKFVEFVKYVKIRKVRDGEADLIVTSADKIIPVHTVLANDKIHIKRPAFVVLCSYDRRISLFEYLFFPAHAFRANVEIQCKSESNGK